MAVKTKSNELKIARVYDAPVKVVWDAWTDPEQAAKWWGPRGFTITTHSKDLKVGGHWHYTMHGPDGVDYPNKTKYFEVEPLKKLVYDHGANDEQPPLFRVTVLFSEKNGKTTMDMTMALATAEAAEETRKFIKKAGGNATWDRLAEYLGKEEQGKELFVINRTFEAPIDVIFDLFATVEGMKKASPCMEVFRADIKPGGGTFYSMPAGETKMYGRSHYIEIEKPHRIVYTQQFCDETENVTRHPFAANWPETMLTKISFAEEGPDKTRVTVEWEAYGNTTPEELATFINGRAGMTQGWTGMFDKMEEALA
ncbi:MAG: SRPBCC domain-containing protein [Leptolyngbya sp.]|nr:SRPBCC domain-containing protein [Candidatus Melainabacteria bacterium]